LNHHLIRSFGNAPIEDRGRRAIREVAALRFPRVTQDHARLERDGAFDRYFF
jgi:hypothetical protein